MLTILFVMTHDDKVNNQVNLYYNDKLNDRRFIFMENRLLQDAKNAIMNLAHMGTHVGEKDIEAIKQVIREAYDEASPEEKMELDLMENQLKDDGHLH